MSAHASLRWRLVQRLPILQAVLLCIAIVVVFVVLIANGMLLQLESEDNVVNAMREAVTRDDAGRLQIRSTPEVERLRRELPGLWFALRDPQGHAIGEGTVPPEYARIGDTLDAVGYARFGWNLGDPSGNRPTAQLRWIDSAAGRIQVLTGPGGEVPLGRYLMAIGLSLATQMLPLLAIMTLATLLATPFVVRRALAGLHAVVTQAGRIDVDCRATRLPTREVPLEVMPLVTAINEALARLDQGYEHQQRFLADAAHELRAPISILRTRIELLEPDSLGSRLREDVARLATLAEQLLDVQRLRASTPVFALLDLNAAARDVVADIAPLAVGAGYTLVFETHRDPCVILGDRGALQRALTHLLHNAIQHGGQRGQIAVTVHDDGSLDVTDEGNRIRTASANASSRPSIDCPPASTVLALVCIWCGRSSPRTG